MIISVKRHVRQVTVLEEHDNEDIATARKRAVAQRTDRIGRNAVQTAVRHLFDKVNFGARIYSAENILILCCHMAMW